MTLQQCVRDEGLEAARARRWTVDDARASDKYALRWACQEGCLDSTRWLATFVLDSPSFG
jgi:hypothetical protein